MAYTPRIAGADYTATANNASAQALAARQVAAQTAAHSAPATPPQGATGFWSRIGQVGIGKVTVLNTLKATKAVGEGIAKPIARVLPGGQNDLKAENAEIDQNNKDRQLANKLAQSTNQRQAAAGKKMLAQNQKDVQQTSQKVNNTNAQINHDVSGIKTFGRGVKAAAKGVISGEEAVAKPIARLLPGGQNDLKAENAEINQDIKQTQLANRLMQSGNPKDRALGKKLAAQNKQNIAQTSTDVAGTSKDIKDTTNRGHIAAGMASTVLDILTAGGGTLAKEGGKYTLEKGAQKAVTGKLIKEVPEALKVGGKKTQAAILAGSSAASGAANAEASGASGKQAAEQAAIGAAIPLLAHLGGLKNVLKNGSQAALNKIKGVEPAVDKGVAQADVMTAEQADKAASAAHTKVSVTDNSTGSSKVGVNTPVRPGIKEVSQTDKINVRTPQKMPDEQFHKEFNTLSKQYDAEHKALQKQVDTKVIEQPSTASAKITKAAKPDLETIDGYTHSSELAKDHADMMKSIDEGAKGGQLQHIADDTYSGHYVRTSDHTPFYRAYYAEHGRAPSKTAYLENAHSELSSGHAPFGMSDTYKSLKAREDNPAAPFDPKTDTKPARQFQTNTTRRQEIQARAIDARYEQKMNDLIDRYHNPELSPKVAPKKIESKVIPAGKTTGGRFKPSTTQTVSEMGGKRQMNSIQKELERAHNAGDTKAEATAAAKLKDPALAGKSTVSPAARNIFIKALKDGKPISMEEARAQAEKGATSVKVPTNPERGVSGSAIKSEARAVQAKLATEFEDKAHYDAGSYEKEAQKAVDLVHSDPEKAHSIALGATPGDNTIHEVAVRRAVENQALKDGDADTLRSLANSSQHTKTSEAAQRLGAEGYNAAEHSPVDAMQQIRDARAQKFAKTTGKTVDVEVKKVAADINTKIKTPSKGEWQLFVESIKC